MPKPEREVHVSIAATRAGLTMAQEQVILHTLRLVRIVGAPKAILHHADCKGGDAVAHRIARSLGFKVEVHPPDVLEMRAYCDADAVWRPSPPRIRQRDLVGCGRVVIAAPCTEEEEMRTSTWAVVRLARESRRALWLVLPSGALKVSGPWDWYGRPAH